MQIGLLFWILMLLLVFLGGGYNYAPTRFGSLGWAWPGLILIIMIGLLGWHDFGPPLHN